MRRHTGGVSSLAETRAYIEGYMADHERCGYAYWAVVERATGELAGEAGLKAVGDAAPGEIELGYAFRAAASGRGYATEVGRAVLAEAFGPLGLARVVATVHEANAGSRQVLFKLGFADAGSIVVEGTELLYLALERP